MQPSGNAADFEAPFTHRSAHAAGLSDKRLRTLVQSGVLWHPIRDVYVGSHVADSIRLRAEMLRLVVPNDAFVCDRTAAWLHGAPQALAPNEHLAVPPISCFRPADRGRLRNDLARSGERTVIARDLMELHGLRVTTPLRTALDLGRLQRTPDLALSGLDAMLRLGCFDHDELTAEVDRFKRQRGVVQLRTLVPLADGRAQSPGESVLRLRWYDAGLPRPELQVEVGGPHGPVFLDMGIEDWLLAAEYDGAEWHSGPDRVEHDEERRHWVTARHRWTIEVFRRDHVYGRRQDAEQRLRQAGAVARATLGRRTFVI